MFPIPFNIPFRKKDGSLSTLGDELNNGGGGSSYTLPTASASVKGGVKIGAGLEMDGEVLKNTNPTPATPYVLPIASAETLGGIKIGSGLAIDENGIVSSSGGSGGGIYYKTFTATQLTSSNVKKARTITVDNISTCIWEITNIIDQSGYTPIGCIVGDKYTGYRSISGIMKSGNSYYIEIVSTYAASSYDEFEPLIVFYVPTTSLNELT